MNDETQKNFKIWLNDESIDSYNHSKIAGYYPEGRDNQKYFEGRADALEEAFYIIKTLEKLEKGEDSDE